VARITSSHIQNEVSDEQEIMPWKEFVGDVPGVQGLSMGRENSP